MKAARNNGGFVTKFALIAATLLAAEAPDISAQTNLPCAPPPDGLVAWWAAEGNANDEVGGNNGVLENGTGFAPGYVGQAFVFNGQNQWIEIPDSPALDPTNALTIETWVYVSGYPNTD